MPRGTLPSWSDDDRVLRTALELARGPVDPSRTGGYGVAIRAVQKTFDTMNGLQGDELRRFADRHFVTKPELADTPTKLRSLEKQAQQQFKAGYLRQPRPGAAA